jgi:tetratricopeptide (TPR) repeat protein
MNLYDDAIECFSRALTLSEDHLSWFNLGSTLYKKNEYKQAVIAFERARRLAPSFVLAPLVMGLALRKLLHLSSAERCFREVLSIDATNEVALVALAVLAYDAANYEDSLSFVETIIAVRPDSVPARKMRGKVMLALGRVEGVEDLKAAKNEDEGFARFDRMMKEAPPTVFDDNRGTLDEKIMKLEERVNDDQNKDDYLALSLCCLFNGDSDRAIDYLFMARG